MTSRPRPPDPPDPNGHEWIAAVTVPLTTRHASNALLRTYHFVTARTRVEVMDLYCQRCRRQFEEARGEQCTGGPRALHLIGGPRRDGIIPRHKNGQSLRKERKS